MSIRESESLLFFSWHEKIASNGFLCYCHCASWGWGKQGAAVRASGKEGQSKMKISSPAKLEASPNGKESLQGQCRLQATHLRKEWKKDTR